jgi:hypothetical protein
MLVNARCSYNLNFLARFSENLQMSNLQKICLVGVRLFLANGQQGGHMEEGDEAISELQQFCESA